MRGSPSVVLASLCVVVASGCGLLLGIDDGKPRDGGADVSNDVSNDAANDAATRCSPQTPFSTPVAVAGLDTGSDEALARLTRDELTVIFERFNNSNYDLFMATRPSTAQPFDPPVALASLDTAGVEGDPSPSANGQLLFFVTDREGGAGAFDIWTATPDDAGYGSPTPLAVVGSAGNEQYPYALPNSLYFTSDRSGTATLYRADLSGTTASNVSQISPDDAGPALVPVVSDDELVMYFAALTVNDAGSDYDVYLATRSSTSQPWSAPARVAELSTPSSDSPSWLSSDLCRLYINTNRNGNYDIYLASRAP